jgi:hypothetical protein
MADPTIAIKKTLVNEGGSLMYPPKWQERV